ncbi:MAG: AAA family ATPase [Fimbriimonas sp.]|nr:AAA family ATPase [Fimbriimonas sp.]
MAFVIAICGLSCAGKTTLAVRVARALGGERICLDNYYFPTDPSSFASTNFDDPAMVNAARAADDIRRLTQGETIDGPIYDFTLCQTVGYLPLRPLPVIVVEGQYAALYPEIRKVADLAVLLDPDWHICLARRVERDATVLARPRDESRDRFEHDVLPSFNEHHLALVEHCDLILTDGDSAQWCEAVRVRFGEMTAEP